MTGGSRVYYRECREIVSADRLGSLSNIGLSRRLFLPEHEYHADSRKQISYMRKEQCVMSKILLEKELRENAYPGRGIIIGRSADGSKAVTAYFIMGRS